MIKTVALFGLTVIGALALIAFTAAPRVSGVMASEETVRPASAPCQMVEVAVDEGYGVTRVARRPSCTR